MKILDIEQRSDIYTVTRLNTAVRVLLEKNFPFVWVEGEISNFSAPHSGHWYFSLKDTHAQVRCAMFRANRLTLNFIPKDGMHVLIKARVSLYENRGDFQLIAENMEERGEGQLRRAYEILKKKLEAAGLFDPIHKKKLPLFPRQIGVITSITGAAIRDILNVLKRRYPVANVIIYPTLVQGEKAAAQIVEALQIANQRAECDVLLLARGGGSLEDLWPFNEEIVAHAIFKSVLPIISGIGHEVDFTIADYVADIRAPTPSAAAEIATPDQVELLAILNKHHKHISQHIHRMLDAIKQKINWTHKHLQQHHPKRQLAEKMQRLDFDTSVLINIQTNLLKQYQTTIQQLNVKLLSLTPKHRIHLHQNTLRLSEQQFISLIAKRLQKTQTTLTELAAKLNTLSPLATLQRGFALATDHNQRLLQASNQVALGDLVNIRLLYGTLHCRVESKE